METSTPKTIRVFMSTSSLNDVIRSQDSVSKKVVQVIFFQLKKLLRRDIGMGLMARRMIMR